MTRGRTDRVIEDRQQARLTSKGDKMRLITVLAVLAVATAVAAGSAAGSVTSVRPDDRAGARGPGASAGVPVTPVRPDDRAGARGPGASAGVSVTSVRPDDRAGLRGPGSFAVPTTAAKVEIVRVSADGFAWPAAFIGAASTVGLCLLAGAALLLRPRGRTTATS